MVTQCGGKDIRGIFEMKRINPSTGKPFKRGDYNKTNGMYFWTYHLQRKGEDGFFREHWLHPRSFENAKKSVNLARKEAQQKKNQGQLSGKKRINPSTGKPYVMGEQVCEGKYFVGNDLRHVDKEGFFYITTVSEQRLHEKRIIGMCSRLKRQSLAKGVPFNLMPEYLIKIFPEDKKCPVL